MTPSGCCAADEPTKEKDKLKGTWVVAYAETMGAPDQKDIVNKMTFSFTDDKLTVTWRKAIPFSYTLDIRKEPKYFDLTELESIRKDDFAIN